jgi:hypothetical protein
MPTRKRIEDVRCPKIKGLPEDIVRILHHSLVEIAIMRRSIESADRDVERSLLAVFESCELLRELRTKGM